MEIRPTIELSVGDYLADEDGQELEITSISVVSSSTGVFPITELNVEPQDYYYANGVILHNAACVANGWSSTPFYVQYAEVYYPITWGSAVRCNYYSNADMNQGHTPTYTTSKGTIIACTTDSWWIAKGLCDIS